MNGRAFAALVLAATLSLSVPVVGQSSPPASRDPIPMIVTSGQGEVKVTPDHATVYIGVQSRASSAAGAAADNARQQKAVLDTIKALGIPGDQLSTQNYSVNPEMQYDQQGRAPKVIGYTVTNTVRVELKKIDQVASVIDAGLAKGANQINGVEFSVSNADEARRTALAMAVSKARGDAEAMARAAGGTLGALLELSTTAPSYQPVAFAAKGFAMASPMAAQPTPIEPGQQSITAFVNATWVFVR